MEMVMVPAGCFTMGSTDEQISATFQLCESELGTGQCKRSWFEFESPAHQVCFDKPFWIDKIEVTNAQFSALNGQAAVASMWIEDDHPREQITWSEANTFCTSRGARLPTEAEWEFAARGPESWIYPWGNEFVADNSVFLGTFGNQTAEVGSKPGGASWVGALDLSGNVWEWVADWYGPYSAAQQTDPTGPASGVARMVKGGAFVAPGGVQVAGRNTDFAPGVRYSFLGFRCARFGH